MYKRMMYYYPQILYYPYQNYVVPLYQNLIYMQNEQINNSNIIQLNTTEGSKEYNEPKKNVFDIVRKKGLTNRKLQSDAIKKKIMRNFLNNSTLRILNGILKKEGLPNRFKKINRFIVNKIETYAIKLLLPKTIRAIIDLDNNKLNKKILEDTKGTKALDTFLDQTFEECYQKYIESKMYREDVKKLNEVESNDYIEHYDKIAKKFIDYYKSKKPNLNKLKIINNQYK